MLDNYNLEDLVCICDTKWLQIETNLAYTCTGRINESFTPVPERITIPMKSLMPSSAIALQKPVRAFFETKYPWSTMPVGQSFQVGHGEVKLSSLKPYASRMGRKLNRKFHVVDHGEAVGYEVARIK